jgi:hypothetical protein
MASFHCLDGIIFLPKRQAFIERGMGVGLAHKDEVEPLVPGSLTQGLVAVEIIAP